MQKKYYQFGTWPSELNPDRIAADIRFSDVRVDVESGALVWREEHDGVGRILVQQGGEAFRTLTEVHSVRAGVGYGGGDFTVSHGNVYYVKKGGRLYSQNLLGGNPRPLIPEYAQTASPSVSADGKWVAYVYSYEDRDGLAIVDSEGKDWPRKFYEGSDFITQPVWHPDSKHLAFVVWDHPNMPWDGARLLYSSLDRPDLECIAGNDHTAVFQPEFSPDGRYLSYVSDVAGWYQLYLYDLTTKKRCCLTEEPAEHGLPNWVQGRRMYCWSPEGQEIYYLRLKDGCFECVYYDVKTQRKQVVDELKHYTYLAQPSAYKEGIVCIASSPDTPPRIVSYSPQCVEKVYRSSHIHQLPSIVKSIVWKGHDGEDVHGLYWEPYSTSCYAEGAPPLIVHIHGGPTSQVYLAYDADAKFYTSRGYAYLHVNHRGSTGYGREYMERLKGNWGVYDVEDAFTGVQFLVSKGLVDASRIVIKGGSAGGFTVLQSLISKPGFYKAGVCSYGVSNLFLLAADTHKFERHYLDTLLGPLPDAAPIYRERSPYLHADQIQDPLALFQGDEDNVVPKNQSDCIAASLRARGVPHHYHVFQGEGHGWRKAETITKYYEETLKFLLQHVIHA